MRSIDFIYFDLGNVILNFDHELGCQQVESISGVASAQVRRVIFDSGLQNQYETGLVSSAEFYQAFCEATDSRPDQAEFLAAISGIFNWNTRIYPLVTQLAAGGYPLGILSNTCQAHWDWISAGHTIFRRLFRAVILSYEVQSMKPDATIYERAIEQAACESKRCFFVDDRLENVEGAQRSGMDAVVYGSALDLTRQLAMRGVEVNL